MAFQFRLPDLSQRLTVVGRTGSGKSVFAFWVLSLAQFNVQPFIVIDYKGERLFNGLDRIKDIGLNELPRQPGLYRVRPRPGIDDDAMEAWLFRVWERENIGLFIDETYMVPDKSAFRGILTQGRSKNIPVIALSQRPCLVPLFVFSEADYFAVFRLKLADDLVRIKRMVDSEIPPSLPKHWCWWYDDAEERRVKMQPVPPPDVLQQIIDDRLQPRRTFG